MRNFVVNVCIFFSLCSVLVLSASASSIPAGRYSPAGVLGGSSPLTGMTLNTSGLATVASLAYGSTTLGMVSSAGTGGGNPAADFLALSSNYRSGTFLAPARTSSPASSVATPELSTLSLLTTGLMLIGGVSIVRRRPRFSAAAV